MSMRWMAYAMAMASLMEGSGPAYPETDPRNMAERSRGLSSDTRRPNRRSRTAEEHQKALAAAEDKRRRKAEKRLAERDRG